MLRIGVPKPFLVGGNWNENFYSEYQATEIDYILISDFSFEGYFKNQ